MTPIGVRLRLGLSWAGSALLEQGRVLLAGGDTRGQDSAQVIAGGDVPRRDPLFLGRGRVLLAGGCSGAGSGSS